MNNTAQSRHDSWALFSQTIQTSAVYINTPSPDPFLLHSSILWLD